MLPYLVGEEGGMYAAEDHEGAAGARETAHVYPRSALAVWIPIPTTSPLVDGLGVERLERLVNDSGAPYRSGVTAARMYSQRGVMTAVPNDTSLGLTR